MRGYYKDSSYPQVSDDFHAAFPQKPKPTHTTIMRTITRLNATGCVLYHPGRRQQEANHSVRELVVLASIEGNRRLSSRTIARETGISQRSVIRILHKHGYRSYKMSRHQELLPGDEERRIIFASEALEKCHEDPDFPRNIIFTDESSFTLHHAPNVQNFREWSQTNPRSVHDTYSQHPGKVNVWVGIVDHTIIGPFFIEGCLTGEKYLELLQTRIAEALEELNNDHELWYLHDGCPAHNYALATDHLRAAFPGHLIGTHGDLQWPARSPDLNMPDFCLWGHIKSNIYGETPFANVEALKEAIVECCANLTHAQLRNATSEFYHRLGYCVAANGGRFEHLIS